MSALIEVDELAKALAGDKRPVVADVRWDLGGPPGRPEFEQGHVPGAQWVDLETELSAPPRGSGGRHPLPPVAVFERAMRRIGVRGDCEVLVTDAATSLAAARLWWLLTDAGHTRVRVLNGGMAAWRAAGLQVETGPAHPAAAGDFVARPGRRRQVGASDLVATLGTASAPVLVDVRAPERYAGAVEPMDPVAGHIPGAVNLPSTANLDSSGRFLDAVTLADRYAAAGVDETAVLYCGSGITAAHSLLALERAGITGATLYPGSWSDWVSDPVRPVAVGEQP
jgi:thiosulfate/3-mercaptopyruvate sulfurtransferase